MKRESNDAIDLTYYEEAYLPLKELPILHNYSDHFDAKIKVYCLEEIVAEKLRAILQQVSRVPRPRDYYDAWKVLKEKQENLKLLALKETFLKKCNYKNVTFEWVGDFFNEELLAKNRSAWEASIAKQVGIFKPFDEVIKELRQTLAKIFSGPAVPPLITSK